MHVVISFIAVIISVTVIFATANTAAYLDTMSKSLLYCTFSSKQLEFSLRLCINQKAVEQYASGINPLAVHAGFTFSERCIIKLSQTGE